jgi:hypothetical protein
MVVISFATEHAKSGKVILECHDVIGEAFHIAKLWPRARTISIAAITTLQRGISTRIR